MSPLYHVYSVNCIVPNTKNFVSQHLALAYMDFHRTAIRSRKHFILSYVSVLLKIIGSKQKTSNKEIRAVSLSFIIKDRRTLLDPIYILSLMKFWRDKSENHYLRGFNVLLGGKQKWSEDESFRENHWTATQIKKLSEPTQNLCPLPQLQSIWSGPAPVDRRKHTALTLPTMFSIII